MIIIRQSRVFSRTVKKLLPRQKKDLDTAVKAVIKDPELGTLKKGDLASVRIHKFRLNKQPILLAYRNAEDERVITLLALGAHENFYRDLKR